MKITTLIRWLLSLGLLIGIYFETGKFTTLFCLLVIIHVESMPILFKKMLELIK